MTVPQWAGRRVGKAREYMARYLPAPCAKCTKQVTAFDDMRVGHIKSRIAYPELTWEPTNWQVECQKCSDSSAQSVVQENAALKALKANGFVFPHQTDLRQSPLLPVSLPEAKNDSLTIPEALSWDSFVQGAPEWLLPFTDVPDNATPPTAMTPVHPLAVGSYGPALIEWAKEQFNLTLRWWQQLVIVRILEHRDDGNLCWPEVVMSCSRRSGKSVVVRLLALWRLIFAPTLFAEQQLVVHSASTLKIAKEPMRYATRWIEKQPDLKVVRNNNSPGVEDTANDHRWLVVPSDRTAGLDTCLGILDEAWAIKPEVVDDDLEPSLLERISPQLLLISTAHRRATSLMRGRIASALALEDANRVLLFLWCAMPDDDPADPETHRRASAHWTEDRALYVARKYAKALAGEQQPEFDDPDPMEGFKAQYLNIWPLKERAVRGEPVVTEEAYDALRAAVPSSQPDAVAVESWFSEGVSVALSWKQDADAVVRVLAFDDLPGAVAAVREYGFRGRVIVGKSLMDDPALRGVRTVAGQGSASAAVQELSRLLPNLLHDGGQHLRTQVLTARTSPGAEGPRLVSKGRSDAIKAAVWAVNAARAKKAGSIQILLPTV